MRPTFARLTASTLILPLLGGCFLDSSGSEGSKDAGAGEDGPTVEREGGTHGDGGRGGGEDGGGHDAASAKADAACTVAKPSSCSPSSFILQTPNTYSVMSGSAGAVAVGDLNGDCKDDVLVAQSGDQSADFAVFLSKGDGTFSTPKVVDFSAVEDTATTGSPSLVAIADVNGDGVPDLIGYPYLGVSLGKGGGAFASALLIPTSTQIGDGSTFLATGDFFGDGLADVLLAGNGSNVALMRNTGGATPSFTENDWVFPTEGGVFAPLGFAVGDFDGDGTPDLAISGTLDNAQTSATWVALTTGGTFGAPVQVAQIGGALAAGDFDGDGKLDLAVAIPAGLGDGTESTVSILMGPLARATMGQPATYMVQGNTVATILAADLNGDGKPDLVTADYDYSGASLLMNQGAGTFGASTALPGATLHEPLSLAAGDFLGNGTRGVAATLLYNDYQLATFAGKCL